MNVRLASTALAALLTAPAAFSQGASGSAAAPAAAPTKVGVLNVRQVILGSAEGKQAAAELQSQFSPRQTELANLQKQIQDAQARGQQQTTPDDERQRLARSIEVWNRTLQRKGNELQEDVQAAESDVANRIGQKMLEIVDRYARENGFAVVIDVSSQSIPVIYASSQVDITQDVVRLYDAANPVRPAAQQPARPAAQPGQTRPPQTPPNKPPQQ
jgi:outer membrane protein